MSSSAAQFSPVAPALVRSPLEQLLHALNQPLTGLQCSMEVALASPRTAEYYAERLRQGLELTERMRALVQSIGEVVELEAEKEKDKDKDKEKGRNETSEVCELSTLLREAVEELGPVAEAKSVAIALEGPPAGLRVKVGRRGVSVPVFGMLESALSLAVPGSVLRVETKSEAADIVPGETWIRVRWHGGAKPAEMSRPELGLLMAQARWEREGATWERLWEQGLETVTVRMPRASAGASI